MDTHLGYILMQSFAAFGVFLLRQFYQSVPNELIEAARIDGLSEYGCYFRIVLPLAKPAIATLQGRFRLGTGTGMGRVWHGPCLPLHPRAGVH